MRGIQNKKFCWLLVLAACSTVSSQSFPDNYVARSVYLDGSALDSVCSVACYDGMGRVTRFYRSQASGDCTAALNVYDGDGRVMSSWLPSPLGKNQSSACASDICVSAEKYYRDTAPFTSFSYDCSGRVTCVVGPGKDWRGASPHGTVTAYSTNKKDEVKAYSAQLLSNWLTENGYVKENTLRVTSVTDEDGRTVSTYTDMFGNVVLERRGLYNSTYYVYNDLGELRFVLPPAYQETPDTYENAYEYRYDNRGRCVWKRKPGCEPEEFGYDRSGRMVFSQDGVQRSCGTATFYLYDTNGRKVVRGQCTAPKSLSVDRDVVATFSTSGTLMGYVSNIGDILSSPSLLEAYYYDHYGFLSISRCIHLGGLAFQPRDGYAASNSPARSLVTGHCVFTDTDSSVYTFTAFYYDIDGRVVEKRSISSDGWRDDTFTDYTFTGNVSRLCHVQSPSAGRETVTEEYTYFYQKSTDLLAVVGYSLNGSPKIVLSENLYDRTGRLLSMSVSCGTTFTTRYTYNLRSWLTGISGPFFSESLYYNVSHSGSRPMYGGDVSSLQLSYLSSPFTSGSSQASRQTQFQTFSYDRLDRLVSAVYTEPANKRSQNHSYSYDVMGNLLSATRQISGYGNRYDGTETLRLSYAGNRLTKSARISGSGLMLGSMFRFASGSDDEVEYEYDANGNLTRDLNKGIAEIQYNSLNLPRQIRFKDNSRIVYGYDADGVKRTADYYTPTHTLLGKSLSADVSRQSGASPTLFSHVGIEYRGNMIYENGRLFRILIDGGYVSLNDSTGVCSYHFFSRDHLGNNRVVYDGAGHVEQQTSYYPYGGTVSFSSTGSSVQPYKYIGKELDRMYGLDWYDHGARWYDANVGRWWSMDPLAEKNFWMSPYASCHDNPLNRIDVNGLDDYFGANGNFILRTNSGSRVLLQSSDKSFEEITGVDFTGKEEVLKNIAGHYLSESDRDPYVLNVSRVEGRIPSGAMLSNTAGTNRYDIYIDSRGRVNPMLGNCFNFENSAYHESTHRHNPTTRNGTTGEAEAVILETAHKSWDMVSSQYIYGQAAYAASKLNEYLGKGTGISAEKRKEVIKYVHSLNEVFAGLALFRQIGDKVEISNSLKEVIICPNK